MMIKANNEYLDFYGSITMSKSVKLIEAISENEGDFSYSFSLPDTSNNIRILKLSYINQSDKIINRKINASIENNDGNTIYDGFIVVNTKIDNKIDCSFFSGNTNWFLSLDGTLYDLDFSQFDAPNNLSEVVASWSRESGVVYPIIDKGVLGDRLTNQMVKNDSTQFAYNDFHPFLYVKDIFRIIGIYGGIKFSGELFSDPIFNKLIVTSNPVRLSTDRLNASTSFVGRTSSQSITGTPTKLILVDTDPFLDGSNNNWDNTLSRYTADQDMQIMVSINLNFSVSAYSILEIHRNGSLIKTLYLPKSSTGFVTNISSGSYLEFFISNSSGSADVKTGSSITIKPVAFRTTYMEDFMPNMTIVEFISSVFIMFNVVTSFDIYSKTVNTVLFNSIKTATPIDLSDYVASSDIDYDLIRDNFYTINKFTYQPQDNSETEQYNASNDVSVGGGQIVLDSNIMELSGTIVDSPAIAPVSYFNDAFGMWMTRLDFVSKERQSAEVEITSVTNAAGKARFNYAGGGLIGLSVPVVVEVYDTDDDVYEGFGVTSSVDAFGPWFELEGVDFIVDQDGFFSLVSYVPIHVDSPIFMINSPSLPVTDFSFKTEILINGSSYTTASYAYFYKPRLGLPIDDQIYSLSFGRGSEINDYQVPLIDHYYSDLAKILSDPQVTNVYVNLPYNIFIKMDLLSPVRVSKNDFNSLFYVNKMVDYIDSSDLCRIELIRIV